MAHFSYNIKNPLNLGFLKKPRSFKIESQSLLVSALKFTLQIVFSAIVEQLLFKILQSTLLLTFFSFLSSRVKPQWISRKV